MKYEITNKQAKVVILYNDIKETLTFKNVYNHLPKEIIEFINKHKNKPNYKETSIVGRTTQYPTNKLSVLDGIVYYFQLT